MEFMKAPAVDGGRPVSMQVSSLTDRFWRLIRTKHIDNPEVYMELCVSLARVIDLAIENNEVPSRSCDLPLLLREVQKCKSFLSFQAGFMVLMLSIKSACKIGWFPAKDADDLLLVAKEVEGVFSSAIGINVEPSDSLTYVSTVMSRFYPLMKMNKILVSVQAKPGYGASLVDFQISRNMVDIQKEKIRLFVARTDHMDTSSCIISPPEVNFLLNGKGVRGRINISMDNKPQNPTNVMGMLSCGVNLLQAIGKFNGSYIIALATMSRKPSSGMELQDYDQSNLPSVDFDSDIMKSSGVSLNCPISQRRIKCFDYDTYVALNLRRPFWRCPYCNLSVCHLDLRIDQSTAKVLREVGEDVVRVVVSKDGSWRPVVEKEDISSMPSPVLTNAASCESQTAVWRLASHQEMTRNIGTFTAPGYDRGTTRGGHPPGSYVNTSQASNPALSFMQHRPPSQNHHIPNQVVQSRIAHPSTGLAGASYVSSSRPQQTAHRYSRRALDMYLAMNNPSLNTAASPLAARSSRVLPTIDLRSQQPWSTQASRPSQNPVNSPVPGPENQLQQRDGLQQQPSTVNKATGPSQDPVASPVIRQPAQVEQRVRSECEKAENSAAPAVAAWDSNWRPCKRMRGSLTGEAYAAALSQIMSPLPPPQPVVLPPGPPPGFPPKLAVFSPLSGVAASQAKASSSTSPEVQNPPNP